METKSLKEKWERSVQLAVEKGIGVSSTVTLPPLQSWGTYSRLSKVIHLGRERGAVCCSCGWARGAHMTELSANGARVHGTGLLRMTGCCSLLCRLCNQISSSTHSSVVRGHIEFPRVFLEGNLVMRSWWDLSHTGSPREETRLLCSLSIELARERGIHGQVYIQVQ